MLHTWRQADIGLALRSSCHKLEQHSASYRSQENRTTIEVVPFQHVSPQHPLLGVEHPSRAPLQPLGKGFETYPSPTLTLERLLKHVDALLRLGHSDIDLKEVLVEGDISLCMDLGMKGLIVSAAAADDPASLLIEINRARKL
jgi:hypothetical protein